MNELFSSDVFGLMKTNIDIHTLGIFSISSLLRQSGYKTIISNEQISRAIEDIHKDYCFNIIKNWIFSNHITKIGFSYRLDPMDGKYYFQNLYTKLKQNNILKEDGGTIRGIYFAGLPETCKIIKDCFNNKIITFQGNETAHDTLAMLGVSLDKISNEVLITNKYDNDRLNIAKTLIENEEYLKYKPKNHSNYANYGKFNDSLVDRIYFSKINKSLPLTRAHMGPYNINYKDAISEFLSWTKQLANSGYLDILSIGTSQLTQSCFNENWENKPNGGGVPLNSPLDYANVWNAARPMLVRTYAGTKNIQLLASIYEKYLHIAWHALSFWWFCELDGRGEYSLYDNLKQHFNTVNYIASLAKPLEANVPHHFSFRGGDDVTYIISAYLTAKLAKKSGIKYFILQNMLNTPKYTWGIHDLAKSRVLLKIIKKLEDKNFKIFFQTRAGLDYFSPDYEISKLQLATVTALMDDIDPLNENSPEIIHVVSYSEAINLANPEIINDSIKITLFTLEKYRELRKKDKIENMAYNKEVSYRFNDLLDETESAISLLEKNIPYLYSPEGFFKIFCDGFLPVPFLIDCLNKYPKAKQYQTQLVNGGIKIVDAFSNVIRTEKRFKSILNI